MCRCLVGFACQLDDYAPSATAGVDGGEWGSGRQLPSAAPQVVVRCPPCFVVPASSAGQILYIFMN